MADWNDTRQQMGLGSVPRAGDAVARRATYDTGLRAHMLKIYNYMTSGVLLSGIVALLFQPVAEGLNASGSPIVLAIVLAPLAFIFFFSPKRSAATLNAMFWAFCAVMGLSLSLLISRFTGESVAATFFATAGAFAGLSLYGYTTKKNLSGMGSFLLMGLIGLLIAMVINIFLASSALAIAISFIGVLIFAGLTAYDTQRLKNEYEVLRGTDMAGKAVILGALSLYLDFVNMFQFLLSFMGNRE